jgi:hypothetical protein
MGVIKKVLRSSMIFPDAQHQVILIIYKVKDLIRMFWQLRF